MTNKLADTQYPIAEPLQKRWSPLAFADRMVEPEKLLSVLEAARWAASSYNEQPWSFIIATKENKAEYERLLSVLAQGNQQWAQTAPVLMLSVAKLNFERNGNENRHAFHDVGAAAANMAIQAAALGLFIHQMAGFDVPKAKEVYKLPTGYDPVSAIALGYLGEVQTLSESLQQRDSNPRTRKTLDKFVFSGSWNQPAPQVTN